MDNVLWTDSEQQITEHLLECGEWEGKKQSALVEEETKVTVPYLPPTPTPSLSISSVPKTYERFLINLARL